MKMYLFTPSLSTVLVVSLTFFYAHSSSAKITGECKVADRQTRGEAKRCGVAGTEAEYAVSLGSPQVAGQLDCAQACATTDNCYSFAFTSKQGDCVLYRERLSLSVVPDDTSDTKFWSALCYSCVPTGQQARLRVAPGSNTSFTGYYVHLQFNSAHIPEARTRLVLNRRRAIDPNFVLDETTGRLLTTTAPHLNFVYNGLTFDIPSAIGAQLASYFNKNSLEDQVLTCDTTPKGTRTSTLSCTGAGDTAFYVFVNAESPIVALGPPNSPPNPGPDETRPISLVLVTDSASK